MIQDNLLFRSGCRPFVSESGLRFSSTSDSGRDSSFLCSFRSGIQLRTAGQNKKLLEDNRVCFSCFSTSFLCLDRFTPYLVGKKEVVVVFIIK